MNDRVSGGVHQMPDLFAFIPGKPKLQCSVGDAATRCCGASGAGWATDKHVVARASVGRRTFQEGSPSGRVSIREDDFAVVAAPRSEPGEVPVGQTVVSQSSRVPRFAGRVLAPNDRSKRHSPDEAVQHNGSAIGQAPNSLPTSRKSIKRHAISARPLKGRSMRGDGGDHTEQDRRNRDRGHHAHGARVPREHGSAMDHGHSRTGGWKLAVAAARARRRASGSRGGQRLSQQRPEGRRDRADQLGGGAAEVVGLGVEVAVDAVEADG